ncbi:plasmid stabilization protein ParE [Pseudoxanthomonas suwonensis]|uniref:Plasmid stabilization protein ParE n=1 Tax=Pseudoxanthomonas suwonensis TaxID=314722 RepID=A0A0E3UPL4_9GAMM|nr:plasmid stabilization protein ParE [Pseudoxanthomonas suwonensis]AKC87940.1 plasmid stabilization protein ParE [Pseudoxanthomonas suwonensis]
MSHTPTRLDASAKPRIERWQPWIAALLSALLHVLLLLILLFSSTPVVTPPQGASAGGRVRVNFVGESAQQPTPAPPSPAPSPAPRPPSKAKAPDRADERRPVLQAEYIQRPSDLQPEQRESQAPPADSQAQAPASSPPEPAQRRPETWTGRPPGMLDEDTAPVNRGRARGPADRQGNQNDPEAGEASMEVGGFQIYYDLLAEERLRIWKDQGMKEISFPLPGMRSQMVCPVEIALKRGSGKCRLLDPNDPEMQAIGDARQVVVVIAVYRRGELVWRGPGPYR